MTDRDRLIEGLRNAAAERARRDGGLGLAGWDVEAWRALLAEAEVVRRRNGEILIQREEVGADLFFLVDGKLEVSAPQAASFSFSPVATIEAGSIVGEVAFLDDRRRSASVWSRGDSTLFRLSRAAFEEFRAVRPDLAADLLFAMGAVLAGRLRRLQTGG